MGTGILFGIVGYLIMDDKKKPKESKGHQEIDVLDFPCSSVFTWSERVEGAIEDAGLNIQDDLDIDELSNEELFDLEWTCEDWGVSLSDVESYLNGGS